MGAAFSCVCGSKALPCFLRACLNVRNIICSIKCGLLGMSLGILVQPSQNITLYSRTQNSVHASVVSWVYKGCQIPGLSWLDSLTQRACISVLNVHEICRALFLRSKFRLCRSESTSWPFCIPTVSLVALMVLF